MPHTYLEYLNCEKDDYWVSDLDFESPSKFFKEISEEKKDGWTHNQNNIDTVYRKELTAELFLNMNTKYIGALDIPPKDYNCGTYEVTDVFEVSKVKETEVVDYTMKINWTSPHDITSNSQFSEILRFTQRQYEAETYISEKTTVLPTMDKTSLKPDCIDGSDVYRKSENFRFRFNHCSPPSLKVSGEHTSFQQIKGYKGKVVIGETYQEYFDHNQL